MVDYNLSRLSMLVIDDYAPMRRIFYNILRELGVTQVSEARDGIEAVEKLRSNDIDLIFVDQRMDPIDGLEFSRRIRAGVGKIDKFIPIIMISGHTEVDLIVAARDAGVTEFLAKPVSAKLIYYRIRSVIDNPRDFIRINEFFGPDRRRRPVPDFSGGDMRSAPHQYGGRPRTGGR